MRPDVRRGTFAIEAALRATNTAPGLGRAFQCESWPQLPRSLFSEARAEARAAVVNRPFEIFASDVDSRAVALTRENARRAGIARGLRVERRDVADLALPATGVNVIVCNPPYGERMSEREQVHALCGVMGAAFERQRTGARISSPPTTGLSARTESGPIRTASSITA